MSVWKLSNIVVILLCGLLCFCAGCVERKITVITEPAGALVSLNDEEIGMSPVTVGFEWYGDYGVRITKDGYQTLNTHQDIKRPLRDRFPFDFFDDVLNKRTDAYTWTFKLAPAVPVQKEELIKSAIAFQKEALVVEPNKPAKKVKVKKPKPVKTNKSEK